MTQIAQQAVSENWSTPANVLSRATIEALLNGHIPAINLSDFATVEECQNFCQAMATINPASDEAKTSPMRLIGRNFSNHHKADKAAYFATVEPAVEDLHRITQASFDPLQRMLDLLQDNWPDEVSIAQNPGFGPYFAGCIKSRVDGSALHFDYVPHTTVNYSIADVIDQFSWNLYLEMPRSSGHTTIYNAPVEPLRATAEVSGWNNQLDTTWVSGKTSYTFRPVVGEVVLFNTRNPHSVEVSGLSINEKRVQIGSFIGRLPDNRLILWS